MIEELWRAIPGYEGDYEISNQGRVRCLYYKGKGARCSRIRLLKPFISNLYLSVKLANGDGTYSGLRVSRLVAMAFIRMPIGNEEVNHKDGNKLNNRDDNLEWTTRKGNAEHAARNGLYPKGEAMISRAKLTKNQVFEIRSLKGSMSHAEIGKRYGVSDGTIDDLLGGRTWVWLKQESESQTSGISTESLAQTELGF